MLILDTPTKLRIEGYDDRRGELEEALTFSNKKAIFELRKFRKATWYLNKYGEEAYNEKLNELRAAQRVSLLFEDEKGLYTHAGLKDHLASVLRDYKFENRVVYPEPNLIPWARVPKHELRYYQKEIVDALCDAKHGAVEVGCHRKGEKVLMYDGSLKAVEDVEIGDQLMGPDSAPRNVLALKRGVDTMYRLETVNGQTMFVNGNHILSLRRTQRSTKKPQGGKRRRKDYKGANPVVNITVNDYLKTSAKFKRLHKAYSAGVSFSQQAVPLDPYFLGILLGDGCLTGTPSVTTMDEEIRACLLEQAEILGVRVTETPKTGSPASSYLFGGDWSESSPNPLTSVLRDLGVYGLRSGEKRIPEIYKINCRKVRLSVLAGLIDADGSLTGGCYDYTSKSEQLAQDVAFVARSLGLRATIRECKKGCQTGAVGTYFRVTLSGEIEEIPVRVPRKKAAPRRQKKSPNMFGFSLTKVSESEEHYGFELDGDHLYLTDTFLVTHNTGLGKSKCILHQTKRLGVQTLIMAPSTSIARQLYDDFKYHFGSKYVGLVGDGSKDYKKDIVIGIAASLTRIEKGSEAWDYLSKTQFFAADESHLTPAETFARVCLGLVGDAPYRAFYSATQMRNDGGELLLRGIIGPVVYRMTVREGVDQGFLAMPHFKMIPVVSRSTYFRDDPMEMARKHFLYNKDVAKIAADVANKAVGLLNHQVVILVDEVEQLALLLPHFRYEVGFAHGGLTKQNKDGVDPRFHESNVKELVQRFNDGNLPILVGTSCINTGTDIRPVKTIINLQAGRSEIKFRQSVGRGTRLVEGKTDFNFVDFAVRCANVFENESQDILWRHAHQRAAIYEDLYPNVTWLSR